MVSRIYHCVVFALLIMLVALIPLVAHADGGAPNLAYVAGTSHGISVIDVAQQKVTSTIAAPGDPHSILLSPDARFLYVTQPQQGRVAIIAAKTGETFCTVNVPGQPSLLALDTGSGNGTLYVAGNGASTVTGLDPGNCTIKSTFQVKGPVYGLAFAAVGSSLSGNSGNQVWVADSTSLTVFDDLKGKQIDSIPMPGGPQYVSIPPGATVYVTTHQGSVDAIDLSTRHVVPLITGGSYGPMDYDAITGEIYVPDQAKQQLVVLTPVNAGSAAPHEPARVIRLGVTPEAVAITSDGQLGFVALAGGNVAMVDVPGRQVINTINVGGDPHFIITGLYPPLVGTTPQQASTFGTIITIAAYVFVIALFIVPILLFRRYARADAQRKQESR